MTFEYLLSEISLTPLRVKPKVFLQKKSARPDTRLAFLGGAKGIQDDSARVVRSILLQEGAHGGEEVDIFFLAGGGVHEFIIIYKLVEAVGDFHDER